MRRNAVVFVHGMPPERRPLDTIDAFAATVFGSEWRVHPRPLEATDSYEARRYAATRADGSLQIDVFEYDWRFLQTANRYAGLSVTTLRLLMRRPGAVPDPLFGIWRVAWLTLLTPLVLAALLFTAGGYFLSTGVPAWLVGLVSSVLVISVGLGAFRLVSVALSRSFITAGFVDVARYLDPQPGSYAARRAIRDGLVDLLHTLAQGDYEQVTLVGHGLGAHIGYDAMVALWAETHELHAGPVDEHTPLADLAAVEAAAAHLPPAPSPEAVEEFQTLQHALWRSLRMQGNPWRITDFVTVGAPLAFADVTMARPRVTAGLSARLGKPDRTLAEMTRRGAVAVCPPRSENQTVDGRDEGPLSYRWPESGTRDVLGAQATFAVTRWTNLWFPVARGGLRGDWFGGPLAPLFGPGVRDVPALDDVGRTPGVAHLKYFESAGSGVAETLEKIVTRPGEPPGPAAPPADSGTVRRVVHRSWQRSS